MANGRRAWRALKRGDQFNLATHSETRVLDSHGHLAGLMVAHEITGNALWPGIATTVFIVAVTRLAMHPMWKKGEQREDD